MSEGTTLMTCTRDTLEMDPENDRIGDCTQHSAKQHKNDT